PTTPTFHIAFVYFPDFSVFIGMWQGDPRHSCGGGIATCRSTPLLASLLSWLARISVLYFSYERIAHKNHLHETGCNGPSSRTCYVSAVWLAQQHPLRCAELPPAPPRPRLAQ